MFSPWDLTCSCRLLSPVNIDLAMLVNQVAELIDHDHFAFHAPIGAIDSWLRKIQTNPLMVRVPSSWGSSPGSNARPPVPGCPAVKRETDGMSPETRFREVD